MPAVLNFAAAALPGGSTGPRGRLVPVEMGTALIGIVLLQAAYYVALGIGLTLMLAIVVGREPTLADVFLWGEHRTVAYIAIGFAHAMAYGPITLAIGLAVQHMSQVLDHVATVIMLHLALRVGLGFGFPLTGAWWFFAIVDVVALSFIGEIACARRDADRLASLSQEMERDSAVAPAAPTRPNAASSSSATGPAGGGGESSAAVVNPRRAAAAKRRDYDPNTPSASPLVAPASPVVGPAAVPTLTEIMGVAATNSNANKRA